MIGVDTNVVVRLLVEDDPEQSKAARALFESLSSERRIWISHIVLAETFWVLRGTFGNSKHDTLAALRRLVTASDVVVDQRAAVMAAFSDAAAGAGFADAVIARTASAVGATHTVTFDERAAKKLDSMRLLES